MYKNIYRESPFPFPLSFSRHLAFIQEVQSEWKKTTRVSLKVFINGINGNERCNTIYDPSDILQRPHKHLLR